MHEQIEPQDKSTGLWLSSRALSANGNEVRAVGTIVRPSILSFSQQDLQLPSNIVSVGKRFGLRVMYG
jgi:hypothetical protein